jgi:hypothetical protein
MVWIEAVTIARQAFSYAQRWTTIPSGLRPRYLGSGAGVRIVGYRMSEQPGNTQPMALAGAESSWGGAYDAQRLQRPRVQPLGFPCRIRRYA